MKNFSISKLAETILVQRKLLNLTQQELADKAGINRSMLCRLENQDYTPSLDQLTRLRTRDAREKMQVQRPVIAGPHDGFHFLMKIAVRDVNVSNVETGTLINNVAAPAFPRDRQFARTFGRKKFPAPFVAAGSNI